MKRFNKIHAIVHAQMPVSYLQLLLIILSLTTPGCVASRFVREIGIEHERLNITTIYMNSDETVVLEAASTTYKDMPRTYDESKKRIIVGSKDVVNKSIDMSYSKLISEVKKQPTTIVFVTITDIQEPSWYLLPEILPRNESSEKIINHLLNNNNANGDKIEPIQVFPVSKEIPYEYNGIKYSLTFRQDVGFKGRIGNTNTRFDGQTYIRWWHYPMQILVIPAFAIDVVTFPIQFIYIGRQIGKIKG